MPETMENADSLSRPVFFDRQNLTADDLNATVAYLRARLRRHNRHLLGAGVACGLTVEAVDGWRVRVGPGYAVLPSGEEVAVPVPALFDSCAPARACLGLPGACPAPLDLDAAANRPGGGMRAGRVDFTTWPVGRAGEGELALGEATIRLHTASGAPAEARIRSLSTQTGLDLGGNAEIVLPRPAARVVLRLARGEGTPEIVARDAEGALRDRLVMTGPRLQPEVLTLEAVGAPGLTRIVILSNTAEVLLLGLEIPTEARGQVWLALAAKETPSRFQPALPEQCRPVGENIFPSRICEGFEFRILCAPPDPGPDCAAIDAILCGPTHTPCPPPVAEDCVVIATLTVGEDGIIAIDEFSDRRRLLPLGLLGDRAACQCSVPVPPSPPPSPPPPSPPPFSAPPSPPPSVPPSALPTVFTIPTIFTQPTISIATVPSVIITRATLFTLAPTRIIVTRGPGGILIPGEEVINPVVLEADVTTIPGVGPVRAEALREAGITTVAEFSARGSEELSRIMGVSEVRVAGMRDEVAALATGRIR